MTQEQQETKSQANTQENNEYYLVSFSNAESGVLYIKKKNGYTMISYSNENNNFHFHLMEFRRNFEMLILGRKDINQISKLDALAVLKAVRERVLSL